MMKILICQQLQQKERFPKQLVRDNSMRQYAMRVNDDQNSQNDYFFILKTFKINNILQKKFVIDSFYHSYLLITTQVIYLRVNWRYNYL